MNVNLLKLKFKLLDLYLDIPCVIIARQISATPLGFQTNTRHVRNTPIHAIRPHTYDLVNFNQTN